MDPAGSKDLVFPDMLVYSISKETTSQIDHRWKVRVIQTPCNTYFISSEWEQMSLLGS